MTRRSFDLFVPGIALILTGSLLAAGCSSTGETAEAAQAPEPLAIATAASREPVDRSLSPRDRLAHGGRAGGSQRGNCRPGDRNARSSAARRVPQGALLVRISPSETAAQLQEADANAAQIEAKLGLVAGQPFDRMRVPDVMNAKASLDLAEAEFNRMRSLVDQKVVSQSEFDQRRTQLEAARQNYQIGAELGRSVLPVARSGARARRARPQVGGRHVGPRPIDWTRRRTDRQRRRLRHPWLSASPRSCGSTRSASS